MRLMFFKYMVKETCNNNAARKIVDEKYYIMDPTLRESMPIKDRISRFEGISEENLCDSNHIPSKMDCLLKNRLEKVCRNKMSTQQEIKENSMHTFLEIDFEKNEKTIDYEINTDKDNKILKDWSKIQISCCSPDTESKNVLDDPLILERSLSFSDIMKIFNKKP